MTQVHPARELESDQIALRSRPARNPAMYQNWRSLLFLHFSCAADELQPLLPPDLEVDTFRGPNGVEEAWLGLVAFRLEGVRPRFVPSLPWVSAFPETNIRTYVRHKGKNPGVWFLSLDADQPIGCVLARAWLGLNYQQASMKLSSCGTSMKYESRRGSSSEASHCIEAEFGDPLGPAEPGSLEFFLTERYLLYSVRQGKLIKARVHHVPYPLREVREFSVSETLVQSLGIRPRRFVHALAVDGVDTEIFAPESADAE